MKIFTLTIFTIFTTLFLHAQEELVSFQSGNLTLDGTLSIPEGDGPFPVVILVHGSGPNDRDQSITLTGGNALCLYPGLYNKTIKNFKDIADYLSAKGIMVFRYDKRTLTHASALDPITISTYDFVDDIEAAIDYVKTRSEANKECIVLAGHSQGGALIPIAAKNRNDVHGLISLAGAVTPVDSLLPEQYRYIYVTCANDPNSGEFVASQLYDQFNQIRNGTFPANTQVSVNFPGNPNPIPFGYPIFWEDWIEMGDSVVQNYLQADLPVLIIQGQDDINVPPSDAMRLFKALEGQLDVSVDTFIAINHFLTNFEDNNVSQEILERIERWIKAGKTTPIKDIKSLEGVSLMVDRCSLTIHLNGNPGDLNNFQLFSINGALVKSGNLNSEGSTSITDLKSGSIYILKINGNGTYQEKVFIP
ncbi:MAG: alpha/beta fold hydrolase [Saprospiraceae bacterium]